jgi:AhpD family alkylhydroperoxidase
MGNAPRKPQIRLTTHDPEDAMQPRLSYQKAAPDVLQSMLALSAASKKSGLPPELIDLIDYRVSQINGCAFCLDMHPRISGRTAGPSSASIW